MLVMVGKQRGPAEGGGHGREVVDETVEDIRPAC